MRLIDWDKVLEWMHRQKETTEQWSMRIAIENYVDDMPTVDAVEVVRCKDCFYCRKYNEIWQLPKRDVLLCIRLYGGDGEEVSAEDYCSWGERREDGNT